MGGHIGRHELDIVVEADDFARLERLNVFLVDVATLVVEEAV